MPRGSTMRVVVDLELLAREMLRNRRFVTIRDVARRLGVSEKTAGKLLARLEKLGYARRYSNRAYELVVHVIEE